LSMQHSPGCSTLQTPTMMTGARSY
jgi:hypothetical protein